MEGKSLPTEDQLKTYQTLRQMDFKKIAFLKFGKNLINQI